jgi:uncharacterized protein (TIGR03118 family)
LGRKRILPKPGIGKQAQFAVLNLPILNFLDGFRSSNPEEAIMLNFLRKFWNAPRARRPTNRVRLSVEGLEQRCLMDAAIGYVQTKLVSSIPGFAPHTDKDLINPWGFSETPDGQFQVSANGAGNSPLFTAQGDVIGQPIFIPPPAGSPAGTKSAPNGNVRNTTSDFVITENGKSAPATLLFSTEDGTIAAFNPKLDRHNATIVADLSGSGAVFKLLAPGTNSHGNVLFATDFHNDQVDIFDKNFHVVGSFTDPNPHAGFAPFGVKDINGTVFVTFAKQDAAKHDDVEGVGNGFIDEFTPDGTFVKRFATGSAPELGGTVPLNSSIGMTLTPSNFGQFSSTAKATVLLVGNFGDSHVNAFNLNTGAFLGQLTDSKGHTLVLNGGFQETNTMGLWGIGFGNGADGAATNTLFFAAGINLENDGLFGKVTVNQDNDGGDAGHHDDTALHSNLAVGLGATPGTSNVGVSSTLTAQGNADPGPAALVTVGSDQTFTGLPNSQLSTKRIVDLLFSQLDNDPLG